MQKIFRSLDARLMHCTFVRMDIKLLLQSDLQFHQTVKFLAVQYV